MPPVKFQVPVEGRHVLPLKSTLHVFVTEHVFKLVDVFATVATKGTQFIELASVKFGTGGTSIHTVAVCVDVEQVFDVVNVTV